MQKIYNLISKIIQEFVNLGKSKQLNLKQNIYEQKKEFIEYFSLITDNDGTHIQTNEIIDQYINQVADKIHTRASFQVKFTNSEFRTMVRNAFKQVFDRIDCIEPSSQDGKEFYKKIEAYLKEITNQQGLIEHSFGCSLFDADDIEAFNIGPAWFEPRLEWLERNYASGKFSSIDRQRIEQIWTVEKTKERMSEADSLLINSIVDTIGSCRFVCTVKTTELAPDASRIRALTIARLAITAIATIDRKPSEALKGMGLLYDRSTANQTMITSTTETSFSVSYSPPPINQMVHGCKLVNGQDYGLTTSYILMVQLMR